MADFGIGEAMAIAGTAETAGGKIMAGQEQNRAAKAQAQQYGIQAEMQRIAGDQDEAQRRSNLADQIETINTLRAQRGVGAGSPTGMATDAAVVSNAEDDIAASRLNFLMRSDEARMGAQASLAKGKMSLLSGYLGAAGDVFNTGAKIAGFGSSTGSTKKGN